MKIVSKEEIASVIMSADHDDLLRYIEQAFVFYSTGKAVVPPVGTLTFEQPPADVHIKYGYVKSEEHFVIKIASGFYENPTLGLPSSNGLNLVFSQQNGVLQAVLLDEGMLTDLRTALAGAVVARFFAPKEVNVVGIVGAGIQARLQARHICRVLDCRRVMLWGRNQEHASACAADMRNDGLEVIIQEDRSQMLPMCEVLVTTTPSREALVESTKVNSDRLIIAMGADTEGKQELDMALLSAASLILMDSASQCKSHGEIHKAIQAGVLSENDLRLKEVGSLLADTSFRRPAGLVIADLTGIATQDIQISKFILNNMD